MASIPVMNPPRRRKSTSRRRRKRKVSPKSIAALKKYHAMRRKRKSILGNSRKKRVRRKKSARRRRRSVKRNPFGNEFILLGNPKRRKHRMKRKSYSRKRRRRRYRNPALVGGLLAKPRQMFRQDFLMDAAGIAAGSALAHRLSATSQPRCAARSRKIAWGRAVSFFGTPPRMRPDCSNASMPVGIVEKVLASNEKLAVKSFIPHHL